MSEVITTAYSEIGDDLAMILTSVPCIMISHDLDKGAIVNHDLAR